MPYRNCEIAITVRLVASPLKRMFFEIQAKKENDDGEISRLQ
jgi:hypothetical protein